MPEQNNNPRGFISNLILIIVAIFVLSYIFNFDIIKFLTQPEIAEFFTTVTRAVKSFITTFITDPFGDLFNAVDKMKNQ